MPSEKMRINEAYARGYIRVGAHVETNGSGSSWASTIRGVIHHINSDRTHFGILRDDGLGLGSYHDHDETPCNHRCWDITTDNNNSEAYIIFLDDTEAIVDECTEMKLALMAAAPGRRRR